MNERKVTMMIGRGAKRHPAIIPYKDGKARTPHFTCRCPACASGWAMDRARIVAEGWEACNCGGFKR